MLYGIDHAKREIARQGRAVIVEGYTDVMACHLAGVPTAVATCGTAFGADHIGVLRRLLMDTDTFAGEIIFTFDGDAAGQKAALRAFEDDQKFVAQTFIAVSPDNMDPCELRLAKGDAAVRDLVARREPLIAFALRSVLTRYDLDTAEGRVAALARRRAAGREDQGPGAAPGVRPQARRRPRHGHRAGEPGGRPRPAAVRRRDPVRRSRPAPPSDMALTVEREALKLALQAPVLAGPVFDLSEGDDFQHPVHIAVRRRSPTAGGARSATSGAVWIERSATPAPTWPPGAGRRAGGGTAAPRRRRRTRGTSR